MKSVAALALLLALAPAAVAQEEREEPSADARRPLTQEIVAIEHADVRALQAVLNVFPVQVVGHPEMGLITLRGNRADVDAAAAAARSLDVPPAPRASIEVVAHVLGASKERDLPGGVTAGLEEVAQQLREVFGYRGVRLIDSLVLRSRDGAEGQISGVMSAAASEPSIPYQLGFNRVAVVNGAAARQVRLTGLLFEARVASLDTQAAAAGPNGPRVRSDTVRLVTDLDVREGQKAVVGKAASGGSDREALIVVIEGRILE